MRTFEIYILVVFFHALLFGAVGEVMPAFPRQGVFTGSFDPATISHGNIVRNAFRFKGLSRMHILINVTGAKDFNASFKERAEIFKRTVPELADRLIFVPVRQDEKNEAADKIRTMAQAETFFFIGEDSFAKLPGGWRAFPGRNWVVITRPSQSVGEIPQAHNIEVMPNAIKGVSSTLARQQLFDGKYTLKEMSRYATGFVMAEGLYADLNPTVERIQIKLFRMAFNGFLADFAKELKTPIPIVQAPKYKDTQSQLAWGDKFVNYMIDNSSLLGITREKAKSAAQRVIRRARVGRGLKYPYITYYQAMAGSALGILNTGKEVGLPLELSDMNESELEREVEKALGRPLCQNHFSAVSGIY